MRRQNAPLPLYTPINMAGDFALLLISGLIISFAGSTETPCIWPDIKIFTVTYYVRPGTNRLALVPYENALELKKNVAYVSWYIQDQLHNNTWIGGGRVDENGWEMSMATGYEERFSVLGGNGSLEIRNITIDDDGALYLGTVLGDYKGQHQYRLRYFDPNAVDGNWSPWYYWSECSTSCGGGVQRRARFCTNPPAAFGGKPCAGESLESRGCNSTPCSDLQKYLHIPWMVGFAVFLVICLLRPLVNIARGIVFIIRQLYTAAPAQAAPAQAAPAQAAPAQDVLAEAQIKASSGGEMREVCDTQGNGRGKTSEHERVPYSVSETNGNSEQTASGHTAAL